MEAQPGSPLRFDLLALGEGREARMVRGRRIVLIAGLVGVLVLVAVIATIAIARSVPSALAGPGLIPAPVLGLVLVGVVLTTFGVSGSVAMGRRGPVVREAIVDRAAVTFRFVNGTETRLQLKDSNLNILLLDRRRDPLGRRWRGQETGSLFSSRSWAGMRAAIPLSADCMDAILGCARECGADVQTSASSALVSVRANGPR
ncbi:MAG: hypothetical protein L3K15_04400 [Thermoplasmata archaeon]|nr:hypothetical protein [Thermoplasmata archaeon]